MTDDRTEAGKIDIGRVIGDTFGVLGRNFAAFAILALVLVGLPSAIVGWFTPAPDPANPLAAFGPNFFLAILVSIVFSAILQGAIIYGTVQDLSGAKPSVNDALATGLRAFLPLVIVSILFALAVGLGMILLIVPGIMIAVAWCVAVPSLVAERLGIFDAFGRSAELTRGNRWRIFALFVILWVVSLVLAMIVGAVTGGAAMTAAMSGAPVPTQNPVFIIMNALVGAVSALLGATGVAVLYVQLRNAQEGGGPQWLSEIFA